MNKGSLLKTQAASAATPYCAEQGSPGKRGRIHLWFLCVKCLDTPVSLGAAVLKFHSVRVAFLPKPCGVKHL